MGDAPGVPKLVIQFWAVVGLFILPISIFHGALISPSFLVSHFVVPELSEYIIFTAMSWIILYALFTVSLFRVADIDEMLEMIQAVDKLKFVIAFCLFVNLIVLMGALAGFAGGNLGSPMFGLLVALIYPLVELKFIMHYWTPGRIFLELGFIIVHKLGKAQGIGPKSFLENVIRVPDNHQKSTGTL